MVMGGDSYPECRGFESLHRIMDGHFFTYICCKNCNDVCLKRPKINEKEAGVGPFLKKVQGNSSTNDCCKLPSRICFMNSGTVMLLHQFIFTNLKTY